MSDKQPLIHRYTILREKLQREIEQLKKESDYYGEYAHGKLARKRIKLLRETLRLLEDVFSGEDEELT